MPCDRVLIRGAPEDRLHQLGEPAAGGIVAVQEDLAGRLEDALHLDQAQSHEDEIRLRPLALDEASRMDDMRRRLVGHGQFVVLFLL